MSSFDSPATLPASLQALPGVSPKAVGHMLYAMRLSEKQSPRRDLLVSDKFVYQPLLDALNKFDGAIIFTRHGPTPYTDEGKITGGTTDIPLSETGVQKAKAVAASPVGEEVRRKAPGALVACSPLSRAIQTAETFLEGHPYVVVPGLRERGLGVDEGQPDGPIRGRLTKASYNPLRGETAHGYTQRVLHTLTALVNQAARDHKDLMLFGHSLYGQTAMMILADFTAGRVQAGSWDGKVPTGEPLIVEKDENKRLQIHAMSKPLSQKAPAP